MKKQMLYIPMPQAKKAKNASFVFRTDNQPTSLRGSKLYPSSNVSVKELFDDGMSSGSGLIS